MSHYETGRQRAGGRVYASRILRTRDHAPRVHHLPGVNLWARFSESTGMQLEGKPVAVHVL